MIETQRSVFGPQSHQRWRTLAHTKNSSHRLQARRLRSLRIAKAVPERRIGSESDLGTIPQSAAAHSIGAIASEACTPSAFAMLSGVMAKT